MAEPGESADNNVALEKLTLVFEDRPPFELDVTQPDEDIKNTAFTLQEGAEYKIQLTFRVNHQIVSGLRYHYSMFRKGIRMDKGSIMVGSYGPKDVPQVALLLPLQEVPKGMVARGRYSVKSRFVDDDKNIIKEFEWSFDVKRNWD